MPIYSSPPAAPSRNNPSNFNERADDLFAWFADAVDEFDAASLRRGMLLIDASNSEASPNQITINMERWGGNDLGGQGFRFIAEADNTGPFTVINAAGGPNREARSITDVALPAGFIQAGEVYQLSLFGDTGRYTIRRPIERITNANGTALRFEDGTQICYHTFTSSGGPTTATGVIFNSADDTWTFPAAFTSLTNLSLRGATSFAGRWLGFGSLATGSVAVRQFAAASNAGTTSLRVMAIGSWY